MSIKVMNAVWESDVQSGRLTLLALADNANDGGYCKPGTAYLSGKTGKSRRTVFRDLEVLEAEDLLQRRARTRPNGSRTSNAYRINIELLNDRRRAVSAEEVSELAALFDDDDESPGRGLCQNDTGGVSPDPDPLCQFDTGGVSDCAGAYDNLTPPEPSFEPKEKRSPLPPAPRGDHESALDDPGPPPVPARCQHGKLPPPEGFGCRPCGTSSRAQEWNAAAVSERTAVEAARLLRDCGMCDAEGLRVDSRRVPLSPYRTCDHSTPLKVVLAEITAAELAADAARPVKRPHRVTSRESMRGPALRAVRAARAAENSPTGNDTGVDKVTNCVHNSDVPSRE